MRYMVRVSYVDAIGPIWWPIGAICSMRYKLSSYDIANIRELGDGHITRRAVELWLLTHSGDFSNVLDFRASIEVDTKRGSKTREYDWAKGEESEIAYLDTLPSED